MKKTLELTKQFARLYMDGHIPRGAAAMAYSFTMTVFPLIICLYTLLGNNYILAVRVLNFLENFLAAGTVKSLRTFVQYVSLHHSPKMMIAGLTLIVTSASAAMKALHDTIGEMQGGMRYSGMMNFVFTVALSVAFVGALYFGIMAMVTGSQVIAFIDRVLPFIHIARSWSWLRFVLFFCMAWLILWLVFALSRQKGERYNVLPGALLSSVALAAVSVFFSIFLSASAGYSLIYGSLASMILLMFWLYVCSMTVLCGAAFNIALRDIKNDPAI